MRLECFPDGETAENTPANPAIQAEELRARSKERPGGLALSCLKTGINAGVWALQ